MKDPYRAENRPDQFYNLLRRMGPVRLRKHPEYLFLIKRDEELYLAEATLAGHDAVLDNHPICSYIAQYMKNPDAQRMNTATLVRVAAQRHFLDLTDRLILEEAFAADKKHFGYAFIRSLLPARQ